MHLQTLELQGNYPTLPCTRIHPIFSSGRLHSLAFTIHFKWVEGNPMYHHCSPLSRQDSMCMPSPRLYSENVEQLHRSTVQIRKNVAKPALVVHEVYQSKIDSSFTHDISWLYVSKQGLIPFACMGVITGPCSIQSEKGSLDQHCLGRLGYCIQLCLAGRMCLAAA